MLTWSSSNLILVCGLLVVGLALGQIAADADRKLSEGQEFKAESKPRTENVRNDEGGNENILKLKVVNDEGQPESPEFDVRDDIDLGLRPSHRHDVMRHRVVDGKEGESSGLYQEYNHGERGERRPITDMDIADDVDLGLKRHMEFVPFPAGGKIESDSDEDLNNDIDLGSNHGHKNDAITDEEIKNDVDLGLKHEDKKEPITDEDIKNNIDLGLKHDHKKEPISDDDIKNNIDLGLKHDHKKEPISDEDIKNNIDLGLKHDHKKEPISDEDIKNNIDLGLKHEHKKEPISDEDIKNNIDLGLKHEHKKEPISDKDIKNDIDLGQKHKNTTIPNSNKEKNDRLERKEIRRQKFLEHQRNLNKTEQRNLPPKDGIDLGQKKVMDVRRRIPQGRREEEELYRGSDRQVLLARKYNVVKESPLQGHQRQKLEQLVQTSEPGMPTRDNICHRYDVDGCSIPFGLPFFFKELFTNSCYHHDICYSCGSKFNIDRKICDYTFKGNMWKACAARYDSTSKGDSRKNLIGKVVENLRDEFDEIVREEMDPIMAPFEDEKKDPEKLQSHAYLVHRKVIKNLVDRLKRELFVKKSFGSKSQGRQRSSDLLFDKESLHTKNKQNKENVFENNLTSSLCDDILNSPEDNRVLRDVELSCDEIELLVCHFFDYLYFLAVRIFGSSRYHQEPEFYCGEPFVKKCLPLKH